MGNCFGFGSEGVRAGSAAGSFHVKSSDFLAKCNPTL